MFRGKNLHPPPSQPLVASSTFLVPLKTIDTAQTSIRNFPFFVKTIVSVEKRGAK